MAVDDFGIFDIIALGSDGILLTTDVRHITPIICAIWYTSWIV